MNIIWSARNVWTPYQIKTLLFVSKIIPLSWRNGLIYQEKPIETYDNSSPI